MLQVWKRRSVWAWVWAVGLAGAVTYGQTAPAPQTQPGPGTQPGRGRGAGGRGRGVLNVQGDNPVPAVAPWVRDAQKEIASMPPAPLVPRTAADLKAIQDRVEAVVKMALPATVGLQMQDGQGSGVIVSKDGYVMTAGHVSGRPLMASELNDNLGIVLSNGVTVSGRSLGANNGVDSGMAKITTPGEYPFVPVGTASKLVPGQWVVAMGHPGGYQPSRPPVVRLGRILNFNVSNDSRVVYIETDCPLINGDSGGPLFDLDGKLIGINSRIGEDTTKNIHVPVDTFVDTWERLAKGDAWNSMIARGGRGGRGGGQGGGDARGAGSARGGRGEAPVPVAPPVPPVPLPVLGFTYATNAIGLEIRKIRAGFPAEYSDLKVGDIVTKINGKAVLTDGDIQSFITQHKPGETVTLEVIRNNDPLKVSFKLGSEN